MPPSRPRRCDAHPAAGRAVAAALALGIGLASLTGGASVARAESTPAPLVAPVAATPCPSGSTPTLVTPTVNPTVTPGARPTPAPTTAAAPICRLAPPVPQTGPVIAPEHTVGGPALRTHGLAVDGGAAVPAPPDVSDVAWTISDLDTGAVLAAKNPHALLLPASTVKTLLALVTMPTIPATRVVHASRAATHAEGTRVGLVEGSRYRVGQLFLGLVMVSGNDTAYALADAYGGRARTVAAMNAAAARLGAWDTTVKDPSGLDAPGQRSSAYDLALVGRAVMGLAQYRRVAATRTSPFPGGRDPHGRVYAPFRIDNHNQLLAHYRGATGVKSGYTTKARHTFIGTATRGGHTLLVTEMGGVTVPSWQPTAALLDWAFAHRTALRPVGSLVAPGTPQPPEWRLRATPSPDPTASPAAPSPTIAPTPVALAVSSTPGLAPHRATPLQPYAVGLAAAAALAVAALTRQGRRRRSG